VQRASCYGLARQGAAVLMVRIPPGPHGDGGKWMLPGGGVEHGEHPASTVVREFGEETGFLIEVKALLEVGSDHRLLPTGVDFHGIFTLYEVAITDGSLRSEAAGGGSEQPTWISRSEFDTTPMLDAVRGMLHRHF